MLLAIYPHVVNGYNKLIIYHSKIIWFKHILLSNIYWTQVLQLIWSSLQYHTNIRSDRDHDG